MSRATIHSDNRLPRSQESPRSVINGLAALGLAYVGFSAFMGRWRFEQGPLSLYLLVAATLATLGWLRMSSWPALGRYLRYALALSVWLVISSIAAWRTSALYWAATESVWLLILIPGIANLVRNRTNRKALFVGMAAAALTFAFTGLGRIAAGREIFDEPVSRGLILGLKRSLTNPRLLFVIPFFVANDPRVTPKLRWLAAGVGTAGVVASGGRAGVATLPVVALTFALLKPGITGKLRGLVVSALVGALLLFGITEFGGQASLGQDRLLSFIRGERTNSDEFREAQLERAWHIGTRHLAFGAGYNGLSGIDDPAFNEIRLPGLRRNAKEGGVHNTFAQVFAEFGLPGLILFLFFLASLIRAGIAERRRGEIRAGTAGLVAIVLSMLFDPLTMSFVYPPIIYLIGGLGDPAFGPTQAKPGVTSRMRAP